MNYSDAKYIVKEIRRLTVEDIIRKHLSLLELVEADKATARDITKFWWRTSILRMVIKHILKDNAK